MRIVAIIQARMGSTRLPGKVLMPILNKPMLELLLRRVQRVRNLDEIIVATSDLERDNPIADLVREVDNVKLWRGSEQDVLQRYYKAARYSRADIILRVTGDNPFFSAHTAETLISMMEDGYDYVANNLECSYPYGIDLEAFTFSALEAAHFEASGQFYREHVTPYIRENPTRFEHGSLELDEDCSHVRLTVDTREDYLRAKAIFEQFGSDVEFEDIVE